MASMSPGSAGGGQAAAAPNPSQPQLKSIPMIAKMERAKQMLRKPAIRRPPMMGGGAMPPGGSGREPGMGMGGPRGGMPPGGGMAPGGPGGGQLGPGMSVNGPDISGLPPHIQQAIASRGLDTVMANRPGMASRLGLSPGGMPAGNPGMPGGMDQAVFGEPGMEPGGPGGPGLPPGAEPGGPMVPPQGAQIRGFNPGSLQDLYSQLMPGRRPPQYGGGGQWARGGGQWAPALAGAAGAYRG